MQRRYVRALDGPPRPCRHPARSGEGGAAIFRPPSAIFRPPSAVRRPPSAVRRPLRRLRLGADERERRPRDPVRPDAHLVVELPLRPVLDEAVREPEPDDLDPA